MKKQPAGDPFGEAVSDYFNKKFSFGKIKVHSEHTINSKISPKYLFRSYRQMPGIERKALSVCRGRTLDVGACAGSHSLYLQSQGFDVTALEISKKCCDVMLKRGLKNVVNLNFYDFSGEKYDTLLFMMNGIGIAGRLSNLKNFLRQCKLLLNDGGQVIFDSSDIDYIYYQRDGSKLVNLASDYYGEVKYNLQYKNIFGDDFDWLFVDMHTLEKYAGRENFIFDLIAEGPQYNYLGTLKSK